MASLTNKASQHSTSALHQTKIKHKQHTQKANDIISHKNKSYDIEALKKNQQTLVNQQNFNNFTNGVGNNKKPNQSSDKNCLLKNNQTKKLKRPQTPEAIKIEGNKNQAIKYPQPEFILKQIQRNINFLKQMYFASLSQQNSTNQKNMRMGQSVIQTQSHRDTAFQQIKAYKSLRKSFDTVALNKKSVPQINLAPNFESYSIQNSLNLIFKKQQQDIEKFKHYNKQKKKSSADNLGKSKSQQRKNKQKKLRQMSNSNLHKQKTKINKKIEKKQKTNKQLDQKAHNHQNIPSPHVNQNSKQKTQKQQNNPNINNLFQIFKFYKRSIDSNLSKRQSKQNIQYTTKPTNNSQNFNHTNNFISIKNQNSLYIKSHEKETPNNSTTKNTTNHKNSTMSRNYGSSIEGSFDQNNNHNSKVETKSRKSSTSNSTKKNEFEKKQQFKKKQKTKQNQEKKNNIKVNKFVVAKQQDKQILKNYYSDINNKKQSKQKQKNHKKQQKKQQNQLSNIDFKKKCSIKNQKVNKDKQQPKLNENHSNIYIKEQNTKKHNELQNHEQIEFPEIQSSLFDRNMPILQEDSRQQASSQFIALTNQKQKITKLCKQSNQQNSYKKKSLYFQGTSNLQLQFKSQDLQQKFLKPQSKLSNFVQRGCKKNFKLQNPNFVATNQIIQIPGTTKDLQNLHKDRKPFIQQKIKHKQLTDDSLAGCEIARKESDDSYLDNFQLVSIEL